MHRARERRERRVRLARKHGMGLRQSDARAGKRALIAHRRHARAKQLKRASKAARARSGLILAAPRAALPAGSGATRHGVMPSAGLHGSPRARSARASAAGRSLAGTRRRPDASAPSAGSGGKARKRHELLVKVPAAAPLHRARGGQLAGHGKALPGNPCDGHALGAAIPGMGKQTGANIARLCRRPGPSRPQRAASASLPGLYPGSKKAPRREHQTRIAAPRRRRARHRP